MVISVKCLSKLYYVQLKRQLIIFACEASCFKHVGKNKTLSQQRGQQEGLEAALESAQQKRQQYCEYCNLVTGCPMAIPHKGKRSQIMGIEHFN